MTDIPIKIRIATPDDEPLIFTDFIKGYSHNTHINLIPKDIYLSYMREHIRTVMKHSTTLIAHHIDDTNAVFAWMMGRVIDNMTAIHWATTRSRFTRHGLQKDLLTALSPNATAIVLTHYFAGKENVLPSIQTMLKQHSNYIYIPFEYNTNLFTAKLI